MVSARVNLQKWTLFYTLESAPAWGVKTPHAVCRANRIWDDHHLIYRGYSYVLGAQQSNGIIHSTIIPHRKKGIQHGSRQTGSTYSISQFVDKIGTRFQQLHLCVWEPAIQRNYSKYYHFENCTWWPNRKYSYQTMSTWPSGLGRAPSCLTAHVFDGSRVQTPGADTVNQAVHPSKVGKLVAISMRWVTAVEDCEGKRATVRWLAGELCGRTAQTVIFQLFAWATL
jgi:hypothetical protein